MMDYLRFMISALGTYRPIVPLLAEGLRRTYTSHLLELGAGAGGGAETMWRALQAQGVDTPTITLTDLYPQPAAWADIAYCTQGNISGRTNLGRCAVRAHAPDRLPRNFLGLSPFFTPSSPGSAA